MASSRAKARYKGQRRPPSKGGVYVKCKKCRGRGFFHSKGVQMACAKCAGDGLVRVGTKGKGRTKKRAKRTTYLVACGSFIGAAGYLFGTAGQIVAIVLVVLVTVLKLLGMTVRVLSAVAR